MVAEHWGTQENERYNIGHDNSTTGSIVWYSLHARLWWNKMNANTLQFDRRRPMLRKYQGKKINQNLTGYVNTIINIKLIFSFLNRNVCLGVWIQVSLLIRHLIWLQSEFLLYLLLCLWWNCSPGFSLSYHRLSQTASLLTVCVLICKQKMNTWNRYSKSYKQNISWFAVYTAHSMCSGFRKHCVNRTAITKNAYRG